MSELRDRLERLATRGSPRGADNVISAAQRGVPTSEVDIVPDDNSHDLPIIDDSVPMVSTDTEREPRSRMRTLVAVFGIAALVGVGGLAVASIFGQGGADSPKGAVQQLADAISHKDPLAAVDVLSPTEVRSMRQSVDHVSHRAADLKIVNDASAPLAGVDFSVDNLQLSTQPLADGFTKVTITGGEISASTHTAAMSKLLQDAIKDQGNTSDKVQLAKLAQDADLPTFVITVRQNGRWYVSPAYTALEYGRLAAGGPAADFGSAQAAKDLGADTPEHAVSDAFHAWQAGDWNRMMALAPPDELPVYDYRAWIAQAASESKPDFKIDTLSTTSSISGDTARVRLDASGTTGSGQDKTKWQVGGTCPDLQNGLRQTYTYGDDSGGTSSASTGPEICLAGDLGDVVPFGLMPIEDNGTSPASGSVSIELVRENGRWFISPVTTVLKALDATVDHIDQRTVYTFLNLAYELPPDGAITLNQPFSVAEHGGFFESSVYTFEGTKGQKVIGEVAGKNYYPSAELYTAAGKDVDYLDFTPRAEGGGHAATLPETGSYRVVFFGGVGKDAKLTLWDAKDAPKGLTSNGPGDSCVRSIGGGETCSSGSVSSGGDLSCTVTGNELKCPGSGSIPICASKAAENATNSECISKDTASILGDGGTATGTPTPTKTAGPVTAASAAAAQRAIDYANAPTATTGAATSTP